MYLSIISGQAFNLSMFERSQNWNAKTEIFQTLGGGTEFQNARTSHRRIRFSSAALPTTTQAHGDVGGAVQHGQDHLHPLPPGAGDVLYWGRRVVQV